ncbi:hypothetical protein OE88DRAFT_1739511 [Heliocybe sulcata]|uniref:Pyridine nucleotide-disulphide oxidoreductase dimerisation domain-containing protein n=1 Tax=Heliocybe sulcata TaxID=5364 RepID=A0A5C3MNV0_9AGAM|nr:hypothetical protein OE88DRAFT_1739511 [Heliocybe sulcata]
MWISIGIRLKYQNSNVKGFYAVGDVTSKALPTPVAIAAGRRLSNRLLGPEQYKDDLLVHSNIATVVFSHPPIGTVGMTEPDRARSMATLLRYKLSFRALYFSMVDEDRKEPTVYKLIVQGTEQKVIGIHLIGFDSEEVTQSFLAAIEMGGILYAH